MKYEVIIRVVKNNQTWDLDVSNVPVFQADLSAVESGDIGQLFGINSTEIALPGTKNTNQFFENIFDLGSPSALGLKKSVPCQVLVNGQSVFNGKLFVKAITTNGYSDILYTCEVFNPLIDFKTVTEDILLSQLNFTQYSHSYNGTNIVNSWTDGLFNGDIYYPLVDYGTNPNLTNIPQINYGTETTLGGNVGYINNQLLTPVQITQFKPTIRLKSVVDKIFETTGFSYTSSFIESDYFKNLYYISTNDDVEWSFVSGSRVLAYRTGSAQSILHGNTTPTKLNLQTATPNPGLVYNNTTTRFVAPVKGTYNVQFVAPLVQVVVPITSGSDGFRAVGYLYVNGAEVASVSRDYIPPFILPGPQTYFTSLSKTWEVELEAGDYVEMYGDTQDFVSGGTAYRIAPGLAFTWGPVGVDGMRMNITSNAMPVGGNVDMSTIFPSGETVLNFMKGIIQKFNLIMTPYQNSSNLFQIEPYTEWIQNGKVKDWTNIVDRDVKWKIEHPLLFNRPKTLIFTDTQDVDYYQDEKQIAVSKVTYGTYKYIDDGDIAQDELIVGDYFASTPFDLINNLSVGSPMIRLWELDETSTTPRKSYKFQHRILHRYQTTLDLPQAWYFKVDYSNISSPITIVPGLVPVGNKQPDAFGTNNWPITYTNNEPNHIDLHYGTYVAPNLPTNNNLSYASGSITETNTTQGAYDVYWDLYIGTLYQNDARKLTCNVILNPEMIEDIELNDNIFIDGHYYRIDKLQLVDFIEQKSTTAELIKLNKR